MQVLGCAARVFTSVQETGDFLLILNYVVATIMNGSIFGQMLVYNWHDYMDANRKHVCLRWFLNFGGKYSLVGHYRHPTRNVEMSTL